MYSKGFGGFDAFFLGGGGTWIVLLYANVGVYRVGRVGGGVVWCMVW